MQRMSPLTVASMLILAGVDRCIAASATSSVALASAQNVATGWLRAHPSATQDQDELGELQAENPEAYAIVKALLTKRSLGLLDPKHPSASFAAPPPAKDSTPTGAAAFAKFATPGELAKVSQVSADDQAPAYPDVPAAPVHHDWLNWKPQNSAMDDEAMVNSVLGAVAEIKGKAGSELSAQRSTNSGGGSSLENDEDLLGSLSPSSASATSVAEETPQATSASAPSVAEETPQATSASVTSVVEETPQVASEEKQSPSLDGLSNEEPQRPQLRLAAQSTSSSTVRKTVATTSEDTLSAWLDGKPRKAVATQQVATDVPPSKPAQNPYTVGLW